MLILIRANLPTKLSTITLISQIPMIPIWITAFFLINTKEVSVQILMEFHPLLMMKLTDYNQDVSLVVSLNLNTLKNSMLLV